MIIGGGFGGLYAALEFERSSQKNRFEVTVVNRENYFLFTPLLHEVASCDLNPHDIVVSARKILRTCKFMTAKVISVNSAQKTILTSHGDSAHLHEIHYDYLILAPGAVTGCPYTDKGIFAMKTLDDAVLLKNRLINLLEHADSDCFASDRTRILSFAVVGGGFSGVETASAISDMLRQIRKYYRNVDESDVSISLIHSGERILPELSSQLSDYALDTLRKQGIKLFLKTRVKSIVDGTLTLSGDEEVKALTTIWTAGNSVNPLVDSLNCEREGGRIKVDSFLRVMGTEDIWAVGDAISLRSENGFSYAATAQNATRQGALAAKNIISKTQGLAESEFAYTPLGMLASLGHRTAVAEILGIKFVGFFAWFLWRTLYWLKLDFPQFNGQ